MRRPYRQPGLVLRPRSGPPDPLAKILQEDLRSLGYLRAGIDGRFGDGTASAVRALQQDLLTAGQHGSDGDAPVALQTFNRGRVTGLTGVVDERLAACIEDILDDHRIPALPSSAEPAQANRDAMARIRRIVGLPVRGRSCSRSFSRRAGACTIACRAATAPTTSSWSVSITTTTAVRIASLRAATGSGSSRSFITRRPRARSPPSWWTRSRTSSARWRAPEQVRPLRRGLDPRPAGR